MKKVFKPLWSYDVHKTEQWLMSMAEKGYFLVDINRVTRNFSFRHGEPKCLTYRIAFDKRQGDALSKGLLAQGWSQVLRAGKWIVIANEMPLEQIKTSTVRDGIIKHNRMIMYIFSGILFYLTMVGLFSLSIFGIMMFSSDSQVEVVDSPYWILTYLYFLGEIVLFVFAFFSVIKIKKTNKELMKEQINGNQKVTISEEMLSKENEKELKRSGKLITKRKFAWMYAPDQLEQWLESMEEKGFNLYRTNKTGNTFYFLMGHPRKVSYCTDYQNFADDSYFNFNREAGWKNVFTSKGSIQKWSIWSHEYLHGEKKPQIYSDKAEQLKQAKKIAISYSSLFVPLIILSLLNIGLGFDLMKQKQSDKMHLASMVIIAIAILSLGFHTIKLWKYVSRLKKKIEFK